MRLDPITQADPRLITALMEEEEKAWASELDWDYSPIRRILSNFIDRRILPGYVALSGSCALGYTYFLIQKDRTVIGALYAIGPSAQGVADSLLSHALRSLVDSRGIRRIEAQIIPLNGIDPTPAFLRHGFQNYLREYLELDLSSSRQQPVSGMVARIVPWSDDSLSHAAQVAFRCYRREVDAAICEDYNSADGCQNYLRSLVEHPGCGVFLPEASFLCLDSREEPCGFILASRISAGSAMIPQISINPSHQGLGIGSQLIARALERMRGLGFEKARLTVTRRNRRAFDWYVRLGFVSRRSFSAYVWLRS